MTNPTCTNCRFSRAHYDNDGRYDRMTCRIDPPKADHAFAKATWPKVGGDDWCGKHEEKAE